MRPNPLIPTLGVDMMIKTGLELQRLDANGRADRFANGKAGDVKAGKVDEGCGRRPDANEGREHEGNMMGWNKSC